MLRGISARNCKGEAIFLCGASGAERTTLLSHSRRSRTPEAGEVIFEGRKLYNGGESTRRASATNASASSSRVTFSPELTALENVMLPSMIGGHTKAKPVNPLCNESDSGIASQHLPPELSGGEQQRVALARAIINDPGVIFADEPTGNLDSKTGDSIVELLLSLVRDRGSTLVVATHDACLRPRGDRRWKSATAVWSFELALNRLITS